MAKTCSIPGCNAPRLTGADKSVASTKELYPGTDGMTYCFFWPVVEISKYCYFHNKKARGLFGEKAVIAHELEENAAGRRPELFSKVVNKMERKEV